MLATAATPTTLPRTPMPTAASPPNTPTALPTAGKQAGSVGQLGGGFNIKNLMLYGTAGAILGALFPIIPGGPIGGALIGAGLSLFF